jgi:hypothetical protein
VVSGVALGSGVAVGAVVDVGSVVVVGSVVASGIGVGVGVGDTTPPGTSVCNGGNGSVASGITSVTEETIVPTVLVLPEVLLTASAKAGTAEAACDMAKTATNVNFFKSMI